MSWKDDEQNTPTHIFNMHNFGGKILIHTHSIVCDDLYKSPISRSFKANHSALSQQPNTSQRPAATQPPALRTPRAGRRHRRSADPAAAAAAQSLRDLWKKSTGSTAQPFSLGFIYPAIVVHNPLFSHYYPSLWSHQYPSLYLSMGEFNSNSLTRNVGIFWDACPNANTNHPNEWDSLTISMGDLQDPKMEVR